MNEWEYTTRWIPMESYYEDDPVYKQTVLTDAELTQLGSQGWELVSVTTLTLYGTRVNSMVTPWGIQYIFKRPKQ